jgi:hypothetical protein
MCLNEAEIKQEVDTHSGLFLSFSKDLKSISGVKIFSDTDEEEKVLLKKFEKINEVLSNDQ